MTDPNTQQNHHQEPTLKEKTAKGLFWSFIDRGGQQVLAFIVGLILANILDPSDFGLIGALAIFTALSTTLIDSGFGNALIREKEEPSKDDYSTIFFFNLSVSLALYLIFFFSGPLIANFFDKPILNPLSKVVLLPVVINALGIVQHVKLVRKVAFHIITRISLVSLIISGILAILSAYSGLGVYALAIQMVSFALSRTLLLWLSTKWYPSFDLRKGVIHKYFSYSSKLAIVSIINVIFDNLYNIFIGKYYMMDKLGHYTYAKKFHDIPSGTISIALQDVTFPVLSAVSDEDERMIRVLRKAIRTAAFLLFPCLWGLGVVAGSFFAVFLKPEWQSSVLILQILCIASPFSALCVTNNNVLYAKGLSTLFLKMEALKKVVMIICIIFTVKYGVIALVSGFAVYNFLTFIISAVVTGRVINYDIFNQLKDLSPYLAISLIMASIVFSLSLLINNVYILLPLQIMAGILIYWALCKSLGSKVYDEIIEEIKKRIIK